MCAYHFLKKKEKKRIELWQWHCRKCEKKKKRNKIVAMALPK